MMMKTQQVMHADPKPFLKQLSLLDWLFGAALMAASIFAFFKYGQFMDAYETLFLFGAGITFSVLGWFWKPMRFLVTGVAVLSLFSISLDQGDFLKLMTTQMSNQDPFQPQDNTQMIAQMAQFSSLEQLTSINKSVQDLSAIVSTLMADRAAGAVGTTRIQEGKA